MWAEAASPILSSGLRRKGARPLDDRPLTCPASDEAGAAPADIVAQCRSVIDAEGGIDLDYIALVDAGTFEILAGTESVPVGEGAAAPTILSDGSREGRILIAAKVGTTRLIDNMEVPLRDASGPVGRLAERAGENA